MNVEAISVERVVDVWAQASTQLERSLSILGEYSAHDLLVRLVTGNAQLWHCDDVWCVTEVAVYPRKRVAVLSHMGGSLDVAHAHDLLPVWTEWAKARGCTELRIVGRRGWARVFPEFREVTVLSCSLS
jgi:hypothetical protein